MIHLCPSEELLASLDLIPKSYTTQIKVADKPNCPLCLFGVTEVLNIIKDNKTEVRKLIKIK